MSNKTMVVALTGGIASGKSVAAKCFASRGVPVIDADVIARELVEPGQPLLKAIAKAFGSEIIDQSGQLRRRHLSELVFSDSKKRKVLESILHPGIRAEAARQVSNTIAPYCLVVIPLLAESGVPSYVDLVLVVDVAEGVQLERLMARDDVSEQQALAMLSAQASRAVRLKLADEVLHNEGSLLELDNEVGHLHLHFCELAQRTGRCVN